MLGQRLQRWPSITTTDLNVQFCMLNDYKGLAVQAPTSLLMIDLYV